MPLVNNCFCLLVCVRWTIKYFISTSVPLDFCACPNNCLLYLKDKKKINVALCFFCCAALMRGKDRLICVGRQSRCVFSKFCFSWVPGNSKWGDFMCTLTKKKKERRDMLYSMNTINKTKILGILYPSSSHLQNACMSYTDLFWSFRDALLSDETQHNEIYVPKLLNWLGV